MCFALFAHGCLHPVDLALGKRLVDSLGDNLEQGVVDLSLTVAGEAAIVTRNPVKEEKDIEEGSGNQIQGRKDPNDQSEAHASENGSLSEV